MGLLGERVIHATESKRLFSWSFFFCEKKGIVKENGIFVYLELGFEEEKKLKI